MGRIFKRGELKQAIVIVLDSTGEAHGYAIMGELKERVGGSWKPSPGAIYPALLALVEQGYVQTTDHDGTLMYSLTAEGRREARLFAADARWASLAARAEAGEDRITVGSLLDLFAADNPLRRRLTGVDQRRAIESILQQASDEIENVLNEGDSDG